MLYREEDPVNPAHTYSLDARINKSGRIWRCRLPARTVREAVYYAYQIDGPCHPIAGHQFDSQKNFSRSLCASNRLSFRFQPQRSVPSRIECRQSGTME
ncbi:MAG: hypothetical protein E6Q98_05890 [Rhodospirillaceae bacterium]|nr:MAG: hypothetical protein E6Q98_05890 [Rhodospirillaceae bacterium]